MKSDYTRHTCTIRSKSFCNTNEWKYLIAAVPMKVVNVVEQCQADEQEERLLRLFNEQMTSDSVVQYLRLLTSAHLQNHADFFCNFVEAPNLQAYCQQVSNKLLLPSSEKILKEMQLSSLVMSVLSSFRKWRPWRWSVTMWTS